MSDWFGLYKPYPKQAVVPESFTHPAKMGWDLCHKIFTRLEELGIERGSKILDPFAGIFTTGLVGSLRGYDVSGMELEPKFVDLARKNIQKNAHKTFRMDRIPAVILQGDSRKDLLAAFGGEKFAAVVGSPAFAENKHHYKHGLKDLTGEGFVGRKLWAKREDESPKSPGQMANLPEGDFQAVISSPPYSESINVSKQGNQFENQQTGEKYGKPIPYSKERANLGNLPEGDFAAVVSSPPFQESDNRGGTKMPKGYFKKVGGIRTQDDQIPQNLGQGETYWSACRDIYYNCFLLLKPGGFIALVLKDFVRKKKRVPLCDQTWELLQAVGFEPVERNRAWLVEERAAATFFGANYSVKKERKSFFRRLAEKNGSPKIDFEEVLICRKP